jgi:PAS domain-containing protein
VSANLRAGIGEPHAPSASTRSLADAELAQRVIPFAIAAALPYPLALLVGSGELSADLLISGAVTVLLIVVALTTPWNRVPVALRAAVALTYYLVIFLPRNSSDTATAIYTPLVLLPVVWLTLYGNRAQLIAAFALLALTLIIPILVFGPPKYPSSEWRRTALYLIIAPIVGVTIQRLVVETRERAAGLRRSEAATRASRDLLASVLSASTEYSIIGTGPDGVINVFNEGAERLLGYR